jgi:hypothetical protein
MPLFIAELAALPFQVGVQVALGDAVPGVGPGGSRLHGRRDGPEAARRATQMPAATPP